MEEAYKKLSSSSACLGPLKAALIKAGKGVLASVLARLFTAVFRSGRVPREWLLGAITAIYKGKGDPAEPNNYRGIHTYIHTYIQSFNVHGARRTHGTVWKGG